MQPEDLGKYIEKKLRRNSQSLKLNEKWIGDEGAVYLANDPRLQNLTTLKIYKGGVGDKGVQALAA